MKTDELKMAKFLLKKLDRDYMSMFDENGELIHVWVGSDKPKIRPTQAKEEIKLIRRLLLEVANEL